MVQPLSEVTLVRPWHWGIAIVADPEGEVPEVQPGQAVTIGESGLVILVRHAQDIEAEVFEGDGEWATATVHVKTLAEAESTPRPVLCDVVLNTPTYRLGIGDADGEVIVPCPGMGRTRLVVSADDVGEGGLDEVWVDLLPVLK
jgi:hypothetical protein